MCGNENKNLFHFYLKNQQIIGKKKGKMKQMEYLRMKHF